MTKPTLDAAALAERHNGRTPDSLFHSLYRCSDVAERRAILSALSLHYGARVRFSSESTTTTKGE